MADDKMRESWMRRTGGKWPCTNYEAGWNDALAEQPAQGDPELDGLMESDFTTALEAQAWRSGFKAGNMKQPAQGGAVVLTNDQIERHSLSAGECPPNSQVILVSSIKRLTARNTAPPAPSVIAPDALRESYGCNPSYINGWNACRAAMLAAPLAPSVSVPMAPPAAFSEWLRSNMPPDTIISDPDWWAMAIWSAARRAINAAPVATGGKASAPDGWKLVPTVATDEMIRAIRWAGDPSAPSVEEIKRNDYGLPLPFVGGIVAARMHRAALAAAPEPPK